MSDSKSNNDNNKFKSTKTSKGFYVALGICLVAIGVAAWFTYSTPTTTKPETNSSEQSSNSQIITPAQPADTNISGVTQEVPSSASSSPSSGEASPSQAQRSYPTHDADVEPKSSNASAMFYPVGNSVIKGFSGEDPVFSITLNDWRIHDGTDFAAEAGAVVKSITDGVVKDIYYDDMYAQTIVIEHAPGFTAYYCGLGDNTLVNVGDNVTPGQDIGSVKSVPCECLEENHLHLVIKQNDVCIDPVPVLAQAQQ